MMCYDGLYILQTPPHVVLDVAQALHLQMIRHMGSEPPRATWKSPTIITCFRIPEFLATSAEANMICLFKLFSDIG